MAFTDTCSHFRLVIDAINDELYEQYVQQPKDNRQAKAQFPGTKYEEFFSAIGTLDGASLLMTRSRELPTPFFCAQVPRRVWENWV